MAVSVFQNFRPVLESQVPNKPTVLGILVPNNRAGCVLGLNLWPAGWWCPNVHRICLKRTGMWRSRQSPLSSRKVSSHNFLKILEKQFSTKRRTYRTNFVFRIHYLHFSLVLSGIVAIIVFSISLLTPPIPAKHVRFFFTIFLLGCLICFSS